ncbi:hypothetical protein CN243_01050 [Sinorhizobium meliloti]|nr:hypothetical protein CN243_01050 [Sinorhizobium meliloti]
MLRHRTTPSVCTRTCSLQPTSARRPSPEVYGISDFCDMLSHTLGPPTLIADQCPADNNALASTIRSDKRHTTLQFIDKAS